MTLASLSAALLALTLAFPAWLEAATGLEPDAGSGALELLVAAALLVGATVSALLARRVTAVSPWTAPERSIAGAL